MKIYTKSWTVNLLAMAGVVVGLCLIAVLVFTIYTRHGESISVPNVKGMNIAHAIRVLEEAGLKYEVTDSGYVKTLPPDFILEQTPGSGQRVKSGRVIRLVINASSTPTLALPDIIDNCSLREAMARLKAMGFKLGQPNFIEGEKDWVYGVMVNGRPLYVGERVTLDSQLILQVGNGNMNREDSITYIEEEREPAAGEELNIDNEIITKDDGF